MDFKIADWNKAKEAKTPGEKKNSSVEKGEHVSAALKKYLPVCLSIEKLATQAAEDAALKASESLLETIRTSQKRHAQNKALQSLAEQWEKELLAYRAAIHKQNSPAVLRILVNEAVDEYKKDVLEKVVAERAKIITEYKKLLEAVDELEDFRDEQQELRIGSRVKSDPLSLLAVSKRSIDVHVQKIGQALLVIGKYLKWPKPKSYAKWGSSEKNSFMKDTVNTVDNIFSTMEQYGKQAAVAQKQAVIIGQQIEGILKGHTDKEGVFETSFTRLADRLKTLAAEVQRNVADFTGCLGNALGDIGDIQKAVAKNDLAMVKAKQTSLAVALKNVENVNKKVPTLMADLEKTVKKKNDLLKRNEDFDKKGSKFDDLIGTVAVNDIILLEMTEEFTKIQKNMKLLPEELKTMEKTLETAGVK